MKTRSDKSPSKLTPSSLTLSYKTVDTPLGKMCIAASTLAIVALSWDKVDGKENPAHPLLLKAEQQLREYFSGSRKNFDLPFAFSGTDFQKKVWKKLEKIPYGKTWSYQKLAEQIGHVSAMRAVGNANGKNPICIFIPCHRVVRANGDLGGYTGGQNIKAFLLNLESGTKTYSS